MRIDWIKELAAIAAAKVEALLALKVGLEDDV